MRAKEFWDRSKALTLKNARYKSYVLKTLNNMVAEDVQQGDITSKAVVPARKRVKATITAKAAGIVSGIEEAVFFIKSHKVVCTAKVKDGSKVKKGKVLLQLKGNARTILKLERTVLNVIQRMSGIATIASKIRRKSAIPIAGTRKTYFNLLDKKALAAAKVWTHRLGLQNAVLIKENHLASAGNDIPKALRKAQIAPTCIEIETKNHKEALQAAITINQLKSKKKFAIMLDNFPTSAIQKTVRAIKKVNKNILIEASGGINEKNIAAFSKKGVDVLSLGMLTHSVPVLDVSLRIQ